MAKEDTVKQLTESRSKTKQWTKQLADKTTKSEGRKIAGSLEAWDVVKIEAEGNWNTTTETGSQTTDATTDANTVTMTEPVKVKAGQEYGWAPLFHKNSYQTTYYHKNGTVTRKEWSTIQFVSWNRVTFDSPPEMHVDR
ncbi:Bulb-type lectin domain-containing protein OS=Kitasatospora aureofaciens OX=1894 GN=GCM10010502_25020 PE=4 SV=1 [Kitasatospora aureofaciens]